MIIMDVTYYYYVYSNVPDAVAYQESRVNRDVEREVTVRKAMYGIED